MPEQVQPPESDQPRPIRASRREDGSAEIVVDLDAGGAEAIAALAAEAAKKPPEFGSGGPGGYSESSDVRRVADGIIDRFPERFGRLRDFDVRYAVLGDKIPKPGAIDTIAKAVIAPELWNHLTGIDAVIWVNGVVWDRLSPAQQEALVFHELSHVYVDTEKGKIGTVKHDLEVFVAEARYFGAWHTEMTALAEQLEAFNAEQAPRRRRASS